MKLLMGTGVVLIAACGVETGEMDLEASTSVLTPIAIQTDVPPHQVLFREGTGPWRPAVQQKATTFEAVVQGPYTVLVVCQDEFGSSALLTSQTLQDELLVMAYCAFVQNEHVVSGTMVQPGTLTVGESLTLSRAPNWAFDLGVDKGLIDIVAASTDKLLIQRGIAVTGDLALPAPLDVSQGIALQSVPVTVTNPVPGFTLSATTYLRTPNASLSVIGRGELPAEIAPVSALGPRDRQDLSVRAIYSDGISFELRALKRQVRAAPFTPFTLWTPFAGLTMDVDANNDVRATWSSAQPMDSIFFTAYDFEHYLEHMVSKRYLDATGGHSVTLNTQIPGFQDTWRVDLSSYTRSLSAGHETADGRQGFQHDDYEVSSIAGVTRKSEISAADRAARRESIEQRRRLIAE